MPETTHTNDSAGYDGDTTGRDTRTYIVSPRFTTTAHPFSEDDLQALVAASEHLGLE